MMTPVQKHIIIAGPLPPPMHGFAYITQEMVHLLSARYPATIIDLSPHRKRGGASYHLHRIILTLKGLVPLLRGKAHRDRAFYVACEGGLGLIYTLALSTVARLLNYPLFIHHHSFAYIDRHSALMSALLTTTGAKATHIFLCPIMREQFTARYQKPIQSLILSNSAFVAPIFTSPTYNPAKPLTLGLLSNLDDSKGLGIFLDLLRACIKDGLNVKAVLAGPPTSDAARASIDAVSHEMGDKLDYKGAVYGDAKHDFFQSIDVFVFPTRYANEAQPTVLFEALAYGVPILSFDRGCIRNQVQHWGAVLHRDGDFVTFALKELRHFLEDPEKFMRLRLDAQSGFVEQNRQARQTAGDIFSVGTR